MDKNSEHWRGIDSLHRTVAILLTLMLAITYWLGRPTATSTGWCTATAPAAVVPVVATPAVTEVAPPAPVTPAEPIAAPAIAATALPSARVYFALDSARLPANTGKEVTEVIAYLKAHRSAKARISGFHDPSGGAAHNLLLAKSRASAVRAALTAVGIPATQLVVDHPTEATGSGAPAEARRTEVTVQP